MAGFSPSTYSLLYKKIKSVATGVKSVNADPTNPNNIIFTLHDNSKITITLSNPIIFANKYSSLSTTGKDKYLYVCKEDNGDNKKGIYIWNTTDSKYESLTGNGKGINIVEDYSKLSTTLTDYEINYCLNDYTNSGVTYDKGFYLYDKTATAPKWEKISAGGGDSSLSKDIVTNVGVGNIPAGTTLKKDMTFTEYVERVHVKEIAPSFTFSCSNSPTTNKAKYETVITNTVLTCTITNFNTAKDCNLIEFIDNSGTVIHSEPYVAGTNTYTFTDTTNIIKDNFTYKCNLHYKKSDGSAGKITQSISFKFVAYGYYGISSVTIFPTLTDLKALSGQNASGSKNLTWNGINCTFQNMIYAYPASYGTLSKVMYAGFDYVTSFTQTTQNITMPDGTVQAFFIYSLNTNINNATFVFS